jgi:hypothetical protein
MGIFDKILGKKKEAKKTGKAAEPARINIPGPGLIQSKCEEIKEALRTAPILSPETIEETFNPFRQSWDFPGDRPIEGSIDEIYNKLYSCLEKDTGWFSFNEMEAELNHEGFMMVNCFYKPIDKYGHSLGRQFFIGHCVARKGNDTYCFWHHGEWTPLNMMV